MFIIPFGRSVIILQFSHITSVVPGLSKAFINHGGHPIGITGGLFVAHFLVDKGVPLGYGGLIFTLLPSLVDSIPGYYLGDSLDKVVQEVEAVLSSPARMKSVPGPSKEYNQAFDIFINRLPLIDAYMWDVVNRNGMEQRYLEIANEFLARDIKAALKLGDMGFAGEELSWIEALLENWDLPPEFLHGYMQYYQQALEKHLDDRGKPILDWVKMINNSYD